MTTPNTTAYVRAVATDEAHELAVSHETVPAPTPSWIENRIATQVQAWERQRASRRAQPEASGHSL